MLARRFSRSSDRSAESGYASGSSSSGNLPDLYFSRTHLRFLNSHLSKLSPKDIIQWSVTSLPGLYQTTAFGLSGLVINDIISKLDGPIKPEIDLIFLDTLHHFPETLDLVDRVKKRYPYLTIHTYKPQDAETAEDFVDRHGERLWEMNEELYDFLVKVEPAQRAYAELQVSAVITGRRKTQGGKRGEMDIIEVDESGVVKINPLANWTFAQVEQYIHENDVPTNALLEQGYRSVGDWHSTQPVSDTEDERAGRWRGRQKTECGIHNKKSRYAQFLEDQEKKRQEELSMAIHSGLNIQDSQ